MNPIQYNKIYEIINHNFRNSPNFESYKVSGNCKKYPKLAEDLCPSSCALCCKTLDYIALMVSCIM